MFTVSDGHGAP